MYKGTLAPLECLQTPAGSGAVAFAPIERVVAVCASELAFEKKKVGLRIVCVSQ
jgi:hypothetical protein